MKIIYIKENGIAKDSKKPFYLIRLAIVDEKGIILAKSVPLFWLTQEIYDNITL